MLINEDCSVESCKRPALTGNSANSVTKNF
jgi:hypothetical protein